MLEKKKKNGSKCYCGCHILKLINLPINSKLSKINEGIFMNASIDKIFILSNVNVICNSAFYNWQKLKLIEFLNYSQFIAIDEKY